jgi:hypothetical protein
MNPVTAICQSKGMAASRWTSADAAKNPIAKEPLTLTTSVPQGNVSPMVRAISPETKYRAAPPRALPAATPISPSKSSRIRSLATGFS